MSLKLRKREKLCSPTAIDALFAGPGVRSALAFPLRIVWNERREGPRREHGATVQFLISVPKKKLHHAVDRVKMRRRIREAYRLNRSLLPADLPPTDVVIIYVASELVPFHRVERAMQKLLPHL